MRALVVVVTLSLLLAASIGVQMYRDRNVRKSAVTASTLYVTSGPFVERMALSYDALLADLYWIRAIQHFGSERQSGGVNRFAQLYPMLDLATSLDPRFVIAYRFGALFLAEPFPGGAGRPDLGMALLQKGLRAQPLKWEYLQDVGFLHYWQRGDYAKAAESFQRASEIPGAPWWLRPLAATTLEKGGQRDSSRFLWKQMLDNAQDDWQRTTASRRLAQLDALDAIDALRGLVDRYERQHGRWPASWQALVEEGWLRAIPVDPSGAAFFYDPQNGFVTVAADSPLHPLPIEPSAAGAPAS